MFPLRRTFKKKIRRFFSNGIIHVKGKSETDLRYFFLEVSRFSEFPTTEYATIKI